MWPSLECKLHGINICELLLITVFPTLRTAPGRWHSLNKSLFIKSRKVMSDFKSQSKLSIKLFLLLQFSSLVALSNLKPLGFFRSWLKFFLLNKAFSEWFSSGYIPFFWTLVNSYCLFHVSGTPSYIFLLLNEFSYATPTTTGLYALREQETC